MAADDQDDFDGEPEEDLAEEELDVEELDEELDESFDDDADVDVVVDDEDAIDAPAPARKKRDDEDEDEEEAPAAGSPESATTVAPKRANEFTCPGCFLLVNRGQFGRPGHLQCPVGEDPCPAIEMIEAEG